MRTKTTSRVPPPATPRPERAWISALKRSRWLYVLVSLLLLAPCYWQPRIEAGDLSSHIYNAWLAQLIESGAIHGLQIVSQTTNILFDLMLSGLFRTVGPGAAQHIAVSLAVLIFIWGAFVFAKVVSGRDPWNMLPCLAILAYGWVFHMGFFNFYLALGLCFWALALLWKPNPRRVAAAVPILIVAYLAHALPVVWVAGLAAYTAVAGRLSSRLRRYLVAGSILAMIVLRALIASHMLSSWSARQVTLTTGLDQVWVFDSKYYAVLAALLFVWALLFIHLIRMSGAGQIVGSMALQIPLISAAAVFILPTAIQLPQYHHALVYIAERMSLGVGVCLCALLAGARPRRFERVAAIAIAVVFFAFLFHDERALNGFEDRMQETVAGLPPGQRVISAIDDPGLRVNALAHTIDRACIGHCYSYANYEPSTAQFRIRADAENSYVTNSYQDSWLMQMGFYVVKDRDLPLYQVDLDQSGQMVLKSLKAGAPCGSTKWNVLEDL
ncbi:MAG TPA: hypothetical protein VMB03_33525 [Bryobacteraceae bacterium]|nr:hypothetical protein [Bryobacteraceae bacterium]